MKKSLGTRLNVLLLNRFLLGLLLASTNLFSQSDTIRWQLTTSPGAGSVLPSGNTNFIVSNVDSGPNFSNQQFSTTKGYGIAGQNGTGNPTGWNESSISNAVTKGAFIEFGVQIVNTCIRYDIAKISFFTETNTGTLLNSEVRFSTDNFNTFTSLGSFTPVTNTPGSKTISVSQSFFSGQTVKFRIFGANINANADTLYIRKFDIIGNIDTLSGPTITNNPLDSICSLANTNITLSASEPSTFSWVVGTVTGGITGATNSSGNTINDNLTNPSSTASGTVEYIVTPVSLAGNCTGTPFSITIKVNPRPVVTNSSPVSVCSGNSPNIALTATVASTFTRSIQSNPNGITGATTGPGGTINDVLVNPSTTLIRTITYQVTPTSTRGCAGNPFSLAVEVNPAPVVTNSSPAEICSGDNTSIPLTSSIASNFSFTLGSVSSSISGAGNGSGVTSISQVLTNSSNSAVGSVVYNVIATSTANGCPGAVFPLTVNVNPRPVVTTNASDEVCSGLSPNTALTASASSTFSWTIGTITGNITGSFPASGNTLNQVLTNPSNSNQGSVTYSVTPTSNSGCTGTAKSITILVDPSPAMTNSSPVSVCSGNSPNITLTATVASNFARTILSNPNGITGATAGPGSTINDVLVNPSSTLIRTITYQVIPTSSPQGCSGIPFSLAVEVNPAPVVTNTTPVEICSGDNTSIPLTSSIASNFSFTLGTVSPSISGAGNGSGVTSISQVLTNSSNSAVGSVVYNVIATSTANGCPGAVFPLTVNVNPRPIVTTNASDEVCSGLSPNTALTASASSTFSWTIGTITGNITGSFPASGNSLNQVLTNPSNSNQGSVTYSVTPTSNSGCTGTAKSITILVDPSPAMTNSSPVSICSGNSPNISLTATVASNFARTILSNPNGITGATAGPGSTINDVLVNPSSTLIRTITYQVIPTSSPQGCEGSPFSLAVEVKPAPQISNSDKDTICSGDSVNISLVSSIQSTFSWTIGTITNNVTGAFADNKSVINQQLINPNTNLRGKVEYVVTPVSTAGACSGDPKTITVVVNPAPPPAQVTNLTLDSSLVISNVCSGTNFLNFNISNNLQGINYSWTAQPPIVNIHEPDSANTLVSFPDIGVSYTVSITAVSSNEASLGGCPNKSSAFTINVNQVDSITESRIILKQPGNLLVYLDNTADEYQWGFDEKSTLKPEKIVGQVYQVFVPVQAVLDTNNKFFWVLVRKGSCLTKVYFNGPNVLPKSIQPIEISDEVTSGIMPNPNNGNFSLKISGNIYGNILISVLNPLGQSVYRNSIYKSDPEENFPLILPDIARGLYLLDIRGEHGENISDKILINK